VSLAVALLPLAAALWQEPPTPYCTQGLGRPAAPGSAWVRLGGSGGAELSVYSEGVEATWPLGPDARRGPMRRFAYRLDLGAGAVFPVTISLEVDGGAFWSGSFARADGEMMESRRDPATGTSVYSNRRPFVAIAAEGASLPRDLFGLRTLTVLARDASGRIVAERRVTPPDWPWIERRTPVALRRAERDRARARCGLPGA